MYVWLTSLQDPVWWNYIKTENVSRIDNVDSSADLNIYVEVVNSKTNNQWATYNRSLDNIIKSNYKLWADIDSKLTGSFFKDWELINLNENTVINYLWNDSFFKRWLNNFYMENFWYIELVKPNDWVFKLWWDLSLWSGSIWWQLWINKTYLVDWDMILGWEMENVKQTVLAWKITFIINWNLYIKWDVYYDDMIRWWKIKDWKLVMSSDTWRKDTYWFIVKGNIIVDPQVSYISWLYYTMNSFLVLKSMNPLEIFGSMNWKELLYTRIGNNSDDSMWLSFNVDPYMLVSPPPGFTDFYNYNQSALVPNIQTEHGNRLFWFNKNNR